jgi:small conductance mechanosensitive channel
MEHIVVKLQEWIVLYGLKVIAALAIIVIGRFTAIGVRSLVRRLLKKSLVDETLVSFITSVSYVAIMAFVIIAALGQLGIQTASFVAVLGAAGLAVGLALQGSLANFAAGLLMIIFKPFKVGDFIEAGGVSGIVEEIGIFTTELKSPDNKKIIVPNAKATADNIINYSANDQRRIDMVAGVSYSDDLEKVADSSVNFAVRPWVKTSEYWDVFFSTQEKIKKRFDAEGITIPFPQQDVHIHKTE